MITRRGMLSGMAALFAAPAIVRIASIMPVRVPLSDDLMLMRKMNDEVVRALFYGNPSVTPMEFSGVSLWRVSWSAASPGDFYPRLLR